MQYLIILLLLSLLANVYCYYHYEKSRNTLRKLEAKMQQKDARIKEYRERLNT